MKHCNAVFFLYNCSVSPSSYKTCTNMPWVVCIYLTYEKVRYGDVSYWYLCNSRICHLFSLVFGTVPVYISVPSKPVQCLCLVKVDRSVFSSTVNARRIETNYLTLIQTTFLSYSYVILITIIYIYIHHCFFYYIHTCSHHQNMSLHYSLCCYAFLCIQRHLFLNFRL